MILLGTKQQAYYEVCLYCLEIREFSVTNTDDGASEMTGAAEILCPPCLL